MRSQKYLISFGVFMAFMAFSCANRPVVVADSEIQTETNKAMTNNVANDIQAHSFVEVQYKEGSSTLSNDAKHSLNSILKLAHEKGEIDEVLVLSWSDQNYPAKNSDELPQSQRSLADKRNISVKNYLTSQRDIDVDSYNMAEKPSTYSKLFKTDDSQLKDSFLAAGLTTNSTTNHTYSKSSRSVIFVKLKE